jgi:hypothetical protein
MLYPSAAGKTQVMQRGLATLGGGDEMIDNHGLTGIGFGGLTIGTPVVVRFHQLLA